MNDSTSVTIPAESRDLVLAYDTGYPEEWEREDTVERLAGLEGAIDFPDELWIEERHWKDVARQNDKYETWPENWRNRYTNQTPTHECTCHALIQNFEIAWNRQRQSKDDAVWLSPLSVYAEANPRVRGGSTMQYTLQIAARRGILPEHDGPYGRGKQKQRFPHTLHCTAGNNDHNSNGPWVPLRRFPEGWQETADNFRVHEFINVRDWRQTVCLILNGYAVSVGRWGHAIPYVQIVWNNGQLHAAYADSYEVTRYDSLRGIKASVGGAYAIHSTTLPDNWEDPV